MTRGLARGLLDSGDEFHFDLSDLQAPAFGASKRSGMQAVLTQLLVDGDVDGAASRLEADATRAGPP